MPVLVYFSFVYDIQLTGQSLVEVKCNFENILFLVWAELNYMQDLYL